VENALMIDELVSGTADVIHDFRAPVLDQSFADAPRDIVQYLVPADALPFSFAALSRSF
jgi:hypothetical protein